MSELRLPRAVPRFVRETFERAAKQYHVPVVDLYRSNGPRRNFPAKCAIAHNLRVQGFSLSQIGRFMGIHHTSVHYMLSRPRPSIAFLRPAKVELSIPFPDLSGEWAI